MPRGVAKNRLWRGLEFLDRWVEKQAAPLCACGCGERIEIKKHHRRYGIPQFVHGHHSRVNHGRYKGIDRWVHENQGKHFCACGCGGEIRIRKYHHYEGIPKYLPNHSPRPDLGHGPEHPSYIGDRTLVKARGGKYFTPWTMKLIRERDGDRCVWCGSRENLEIDHITSVRLDGDGTVENGQLLCHSCHVKKNRFEWLIEKTVREQMPRELGAYL